MKPSGEVTATNHRLKWEPLPSNRVGKISQHVIEREGREEGKGF